MFDGTTLIVDVETLGENSYALSLPAEDLWVAYEVVRRHVDDNGVRHYSQMTEAKTTADGYSFKFDTGDTFTCSSHLDRPTSSTLSDETGGGSGGVLIVNGISTETGATLDKTWAEINDATVAFVTVKIDDVVKVSPICTIGTTTNFITGEITAYYVDIIMYGDSVGDSVFARFSSNTEDGVLTMVQE